MQRRGMLSRLLTLSALAGAAAAASADEPKIEATKKPLKIMMKSAWGSDDPKSRRAEYPDLRLRRLQSSTRYRRVGSDQLERQVR
jgi:hypothetical protein